MVLNLHATGIQGCAPRRVTAQSSPREGLSIGSQDGVH